MTGSDPIAGALGRLNSSDSSEQVKAALSLRRLNAREAVPYLLAHLDTPDSGLRWAVVYALEQLGDAQIAAYLYPYVADPGKHVRGAVLRALGRYGDENAQAALLNALNDPEPYVRFCALRGLEHLANPATIPMIEAMLHDDARVWESCGESVKDTASAVLRVIRMRGQLRALEQVTFPREAFEIGVETAEAPRVSHPMLEIPNLDIALPPLEMEQEPPPQKPKIKREQLDHLMDLPGGEPVKNPLLTNTDPIEWLDMLAEKHATETHERVHINPEDLIMEEEDMSTDEVMEWLHEWAEDSDEDEFVSPDEEGADEWFDQIGKEDEPPAASEVDDYYTVDEPAEELPDEEDNKTAEDDIYFDGQDWFTDTDLIHTIPAEDVDLIDTGMFDPVDPDADPNPTPPRRGDVVTEELPDWLNTSDTPSFAEETSDMPDWLREDVPMGGESLDEIFDSADSAAPEPEPDEALVSSNNEEDIIPDWLQDSLPDTGNLNTDIFDDEAADMVEDAVQEVEAVLPEPNALPDFDNMTHDELMRWMETLAKRQGAKGEELTTSADADIAEVDPNTAIIDEPGYVPMEGGKQRDEAPRPPSPPATTAFPQPAVPAPAPITAEPRTSQVMFSAYYPAQVTVQQRYSLYLYAHEQEAADRVQRDVQKFRDELGGEVNEPRTAKRTAALKDGTAVTVIPESDELTFEPASLTKTWWGNFTRFGFDFIPNADMAGETAVVRLSVLVEGIEIAHVKVAFEMNAAPAVQLVSQMAPENPLAAAKLQSETVTPYQRIFISYSREDSLVAQAYKLAQTALGNEVFLDVDNLRAGENWQAALAKAIDDADVFQLFWSEHSASSPYCKYEWEYSLNHRCEDNRCETFIRPVYWEKPMPTVPNELRHINFRYVPFQLSED